MVQLLSGRHAKSLATGEQTHSVSCCLIDAFNARGIYRGAPPVRTGGARPCAFKWSRTVSNGLDEPELRERSHAVIEADFFDDLAVLQTQHRRAREVHLAA